MDISLYVRDLEGFVHGVDVIDGATVQDIFVALQGTDGVKTEGCGLVLDDVPLNRDDDIAETGIVKDSVLQLIPNKINLKWELYDGDQSTASFEENDTVVINKYVCIIVRFIKAL